MEEELDQSIGTQGPPRLSEEHVWGSQVGAAFSRQGEHGQIPIVVIPQRVILYLNGLIVAGGVVAGATLLLATLFNLGFLAILGFIPAGAMLLLGVLRWFYVMVPEGANGLVSRIGQYQRTIGSGLHILPPPYTVSHFVTRREISFDVPIVEARTADDVRAQLDTLITFSITDPARFVFSISTPDYDQVLQAACQEALRAMIRQTPAEQLNDLVGAGADGPRAQIEAIVAPYGVTIHRLIITFALLPAEILNSQENRQLAIIQRAEQVEQQALAQLRLGDNEDLEKLHLIARIEREREELEARLRLVEQAAALEEERLERLEARLRRYPLAAQWELEQARLAVARSLAGNTRAIVQVDGDGAVGGLLAMRDLLKETDAAGETPNGTGEHNTGRPGRNVGDHNDDVSFTLGTVRVQATTEE